MKHCPVMFVLLLTLCGCGGFGPGLTDFTADFKNGYQLRQTSSQRIHIVPVGGWDDESEVPAKVVACGYNDQFVIAKQQKRDVKGNPIRGAYQYWIVEAPQKKRHGPFTEKEFGVKRKEFGVPDSVELRSTNSFRP